MDAFAGYFTPGKYHVHATASRKNHYDSEPIAAIFEVAWPTLASPTFQCNNRDCSDLQQRVANLSISAPEEAIAQGLRQPNRLCVVSVLWLPAGSILHVPRKLSPFFPTVALKSVRSGKYCTVESSFFVCNSVSQEAFTVEDADGKVALRHTSSGEYCTSDEDSGSVLKCDQARLRCLKFPPATVLACLNLFCIPAENLLCAIFYSESGKFTASAAGGVSNLVSSTRRLKYVRVCRWTDCPESWGSVLC